jgi:hypothetical protein
MPDSRDDQSIFGHLAEAGALYDRYLEIARVAQIPTQDEMQTVAAQVPPPTDLPLTLEIHTQV